MFSFSELPVGEGVMRSTKEEDSFSIRMRGGWVDGVGSSVGIHDASNV
jgi:hypothetical protein